LIEEIRVNTTQRIAAHGLTLAAIAILLTSPAQAVTLEKESIRLPESAGVLPGNSPGAQAANSYCLMCHSADMVMNQPELSKAGWLAEVNKMKDVMKAPIPEDQVSEIVDYLYSIKGKK
jgi:cytochrome c5